VQVVKGRIDGCGWTKQNDPPPAYLSAPISGQFLGILTAPDTTPPTAVRDLAVDPTWLVFPG